MATSLLPADFKEFLKLLNSPQVEYLWIGGYARWPLQLYPRATADIVIWIANTGTVPSGKQDCPHARTAFPHRNSLTTISGVGLTSIMQSR